MSARDGTVIETLVGGIGSIDKIRQSIIVGNLLLAGIATKNAMVVVAWAAGKVALVIGIDSLVV